MAVSARLGVARLGATRLGLSTDVATTGWIPTRGYGAGVQYVTVRGFLADGTPPTPTDHLFGTRWWELLAGDFMEQVMTSTDTFPGTKSATTSASVLASSNQPVTMVVVQADPANTQNVIVGNSQSQYHVLVAGDFIPMFVNNLNRVYVKSASGTQTVNYLGYF